ncbi:oxygen-independent coproporphyrinogen III oxidase [Bartonella sp. W8098]|uniref:oxygen-independent coproporphyrinogen III oxidase n=1 Tax=Bartonella TaxID=773 RepID=UPI0018DD4382|nr:MULTISPECIES: oxygen-independent coproporphyrinogen III oxidase [Bartonella]MBH9987827.1 oxygen-independent coproporphyrinogen III oxidase [Bartonella apis]MBI0172096.1 oxygen-independent coproporphyrinogen III oxidase [Bartonella sp. W8151]
MKTETLLHYATLAVPRYTSYPTAADFVAVTDEQRADWLGKIKPDQAVSLYIHVPYCRQLCYYCGCHAKATKKDDAIVGYAESVIKDIRLQAQHLKGKSRVVHLHWGGGTPSILPRQSFLSIMETLHEFFEFDKKAEHAIELDPRTVTHDLVKTLLEIGVNRTSLGVQDVNPQVQKAIGRIQPAAIVKRSVDYLREAGLEHINFDLIYGLPLQTIETLNDTCRTIGEYHPNRIACYGYAHLPKRRANQRLIDAALLPGPLERFYQAAAVEKNLVDMGYIPIGIDHFALPDDHLAIAAKEHHLHRNFQGYTDDDCPVLIGFGCSSISEFRDGFAQTVAGIAEYRRTIDANKMATVRGIATNDDDRLRASMIAKLMCDFKLDLSKFGGKAKFQSALEHLKPIIADGLATEHDGIIEMTEEGRPFVRAVASLFDAYRQQNLAQFSAAV